MGESAERIKKLNKKLREGLKCSLCGRSSDAKGFIHFHHMKPTKLSGDGRGRWERYYDIIKNPKSYIPLCKKCHMKIHRYGGEEFAKKLQNMWEKSKGSWALEKTYKKFNDMP